MFSYNKKIKNIIIYAVLTSLLIAMLVYSFTISLGYDLKLLNIVTISILIFVITNFVFYSKKTFGISLIGSITIIALISIVIYKTNSFDYRMNKLIYYLMTIEESLYSKICLDKNIQLFFAIITAVITSIIINIIWIKKNSFIALLLFCFGFSFVMYQVSTFGVIGKQNFIFIFLIMLNIYFYYIARQKKILNNIKSLQFIILAFAISISCIFITNRIYNTFSEPLKFIKIFPDKDSKVNTKKKDEKDKVKKPAYAKYIVNENNVNNIPMFFSQNVCSVSAHQKIYLRGAAFDIYNNNSWENELRGLDNFIIQDSIDIHYEDNILKNVYENIIGLCLKEGLDCSKYVNGSIEDLMEDNEIINKYFMVDDVRIQIKKLKSDSILLPLNYFKVEFEISEKTNKDDLFNQVQLNEDETLTKNNILKENMTYSTKILTPNYSSPEIIALLRKTHRGYYNEFDNQYAKNYSSMADRTIYSGRSPYLQTPNEINKEKILELANKITKECTNDYDKAVAIEQYLKTNYIYNLKPEISTESEDCISDFLFNTKEGYCKNFATSMVIILRLLDIPSRYVTGFVAKDLPFYADYYNNNISPGSFREYEVKDNNAHAWVEVYFEGFGWVPFEPTSGFTYQDEISTNSNINNVNADNKNNADAVLNEPNKNNLTIVLVTIIFVTLLSMIVLYIIKKKNLLKGNTNQKYKLYFRFLIHLYGYMGLKKNKQETLTQYYEKNKKYFKENK